MTIVETCSLGSLAVNAVWLVYTVWRGTRKPTRPPAELAPEQRWIHSHGLWWRSFRPGVVGYATETEHSWIWWVVQDGHRKQEGHGVGDHHARVSCEDWVANHLR